MSCFYCDPENEGRKAIMFRVGKMREGVLYLFKDQAHKGRCVVAVDEHLAELSDLTEQQRHDYMDDVADAAGAVKKLWGCTKINLGAYGETSCRTCISISFRNTKAALNTAAVLRSPIRTRFI